MDSNEEMEDILNMTYPGLTMLYRDTNLGILGNRYEEAMIIRERAFTDASKRGGGIVTTHRSAILSNHYMDASEFEHGTNWRLCIMQKDSHFKIRDVYEKHGKIQITLMHLPEDHWIFFKNVKTNVDEQVVTYARNRFDECLSTKPVPELITSDWLDRCSFPLGMNDSGISIMSP